MNQQDGNNYLSYNYILKNLNPKSLNKSYLNSNRIIMINYNNLNTIIFSIIKLDNYIINEIVKLLHNIGMRDNLLGYHCYIEGVVYSLSINSYDNKYMQCLYENGKNKFNKNTSAIERNMRYAKDISWKYNSNSYIEKVLGYPFNYKKTTPTNMELIIILVECIRIIIGS